MKSKNRILPTLIVIASLISLFAFKNASSNNPTKPPSTESRAEQARHSELPVEFQRLTIPYLRKQTYQSQISSLEMIERNSDYVSYLTSYTSEGNRINALLTKPNQEQPENGWPAVVFVHGYIPPPSYKTQERYIDYVDNLAKSGLVVFKIDLRGHGNSQGQARGAYFSADYVIDVLNAIAALKSSGFVNPDKVGLWGHSMSGNVVLRALVVQPTIPATVIWAGTRYPIFKRFVFSVC
ncbi:MAG: alpha/beta hydrolase family protein [Patescibacteria group bacterium]